MRIDFHASPEPTLGVEWELMLVDRVSRDLVSSGSELHELAGGRLDDPSRLHKELLRNTVEIVTGICDTVGEAVTDLRDTLAVVAPAARELGVDLMGAGSHPFADWSAPAADRRPPLRRADQPHPVVGPPDADLGRPRARRHARA